MNNTNFPPINDDSSSTVTSTVRSGTSPDPLNKPNFDSTVYNADENKNFIDIIKEKWEDIKETVKNQWKLTDKEVSEVKGSYETLSSNLKRSHGYSDEEANRNINDFVRTNGWHNK